MDDYTRARIQAEQDLQRAAQERADQARNDTLARLAMEAEAEQTRQAMAEKRRADHDRQDAANREQGFWDNWRR